MSPMKAQPEGTSRVKLDEQVVDVGTGKTQTTKFGIDFTDDELGKVRIGETHRKPKGWEPQSVVPKVASPVDPFKAHNDAMNWLRGEWAKARAKGWKPAGTIVLEMQPEAEAEAWLAANPQEFNPIPTHIPPRFPASDSEPGTEVPPAHEGPIVTKSGKVLTEEHIQALADEAEAGYEQDAEGQWHAVQPAEVVVEVPTEVPAATEPQSATTGSEDTAGPSVMLGEPVLVAPQEAIGWQPAVPFTEERADETSAEEAQAVQPDTRDDVPPPAMEAESIRAVPAGSPEDPDSAFYQERMQTPVPDEGIPAEELDAPGPAVDWLDQRDDNMFEGEVFPLP